MEVEDRDFPALVVTQDPPEQPEVVESQVQVEHKEHPDHQVLMITGTFHSENRQGLVAILAQRAPDLEIRVLTPDMSAHGNQETDARPEITTGDYRYELWPMPVTYRDKDRETAAMMDRFRNARSLNCPE